MSEKLNPSYIRSLLTITLDDLIVVDSIGSTNDALYALLKKNPHQRIVYLSEEQTAGKGRQGKSWYSPKYQHVYCSLSWRVKKTIIEIQDLSMAIGKVLRKMLQRYGLDDLLSLKYPNDILYDNKKLLGILIETFPPTPNETTVIIGIGCNVHAENNAGNPINQPWTSLDQIMQSVNDRNKISVLIINTVYSFLDNAFTS